MRNNFAGARDDIGADLNSLRRDISHLADALRGLVDVQAQTAGDRLSGAYGDARSKISTVAGGLSNAAGGARKSVRSARGEIEASIDRNPLAAVLIALGVGLVIGFLGRSRA